MLSSTTRFLGFAEFYLCSGQLSVDVCHKKQLLVVSCQKIQPFGISTNRFTTKGTKVTKITSWYFVFLGGFILPRKKAARFEPPLLLRTNN